MDCMSVSKESTSSNQHLQQEHVPSMKPPMTAKNPCTQDKSAGHVDPSYKYIFMLGLNLTRHSLNDVRDISLPLHPRRFRDPHRHLAHRPDLLHTPPVPSRTGKVPSDLRRRVRRNERRNQRVRRLPRRCGRVRGYARVRVREAVAVREAKVS